MCTLRQHAKSYLARTRKIKAHFGSWAQDISVKADPWVLGHNGGITTALCGSGCNDHGGMSGDADQRDGRQEHVNTGELEWMSTTQPCMPSAITYAVYEDALTSAWKHDRLICYNWGGFIVGSYTLPTYYFALRQSWKRSRRDSEVWIEGLKKSETSRKEGSKSPNWNE